MRYIVLAVTLALLAGCGGGGGSGSTAGGVTTIPAPPANTVQTRQIQAGDRLVYTVVGDVRSPVAGTAILTTSLVNAIPELGYMVFKQILTVDFTVDGQHLFNSATTYLWQSSNGTMMYLAGEDPSGNLITVATSSGGVVEWPSPMGATPSWSYDATYSNGTTKSRTCTVLGQENMQGIPAYYIEENLQTNDGQYNRTARNYRWFAPSIGYAVKTDSAYWIDANSTLYLTLTLQSKNF